MILRLKKYGICLRSTLEREISPTDLSALGPHIPRTSSPPPPSFTIPRVSKSRIAPQPSPGHHVRLGYHLIFSDNGSPFLMYSWGIYEVQAIPWDVAVINRQLYLRSHGCPGETLRMTCSSCRSLENHNVVMGIRHRSIHGAHEKTHWTYLSMPSSLASYGRRLARTINSVLTA